MGTRLLNKVVEVLLAARPLPLRRPAPPRAHWPGGDGRGRGAGSGSGSPVLGVAAAGRPGVAAGPPGERVGRRPRSW